MNNPLERQDSLLYHYTNLNALIGILRSECIVLWATNAAYLNDPTELKQGIKIVNELKIQISNLMISRIFISLLFQIMPTH